MRRLRSRRWLLLGLTGALLLGLIAEVASLALAYRDAERGAAALERASAALGPDPARWDASRIAAAEVQRRQAEQLLAPVGSRLDRDPLLAALALLPWAGDQVRAARDLAGAGLASARALSDIETVAGRYDAARNQGGAPGPRFVQLTAEAAPDLDQADALLGPAVESLRRDRRARLAGPLQVRVGAALAALEPVASQVSGGATAGRYLPAALGAAGPRTYLLLLPNPAELRPAGGFVGEAGTITVDRGTPTVQVHDQAFYDHLMQGGYPVPHPMGEYLRFYRGQLELGDAGWDPDFPTTARLSERMLADATGAPVDGTISVDPYAIAALLAITGPVEVAGYGTFTSADFFERIDRIVNVDQGPGSGKEALSVIAPVLLGRILGASVAGWPAMLAAFGTQVDGRHIQLWLHDPTLAAAAAGHHADGALLGVSGDSLMVVDGNLGATKGDYYLTKSADLKVEVHPDGVVRHVLTLHYDLPPPGDDVDRALNPGLGTYLDNVRVYLPATTSLARVDLLVDGLPGGGGLDRVTVEHGHLVVAANLRLARGHRADVRVAYSYALLPAPRFSLTLQKQAGVPGLPLTFELSYPGGLASGRLGLAHDERLEASW